MTTIDWENFDRDHPVFEKLKGGFRIHSERTRTSHKLWEIPRWLGVGDLAVIFGASESGKSVFAVDMACRLAAGLDFDGGNFPYRRNVLYVAAERSEQIDRRIDAFCAHHEGEKFENLMVYSGSIDLTQPDALRTIVRASQWVSGWDSVDVVIIDTLAAAMSISDSNPEAMARAVQNLATTQRNGNLDDSGCTVVVVHHTPVSGEQRIRGGGQLQGAADITINVSRKRDVSTAKVVKNNESPDRPTRSYKMESVSLGVSDDGFETIAPVLVSVAAQTKVKAQPKATKATSEALDVLRNAVAANDNQPVTEDQWRAAVYDRAGDISDSGKRLKFSRQRRAVEGLAVEFNGTFSVP